MRLLSFYRSIWIWSREWCLSLKRTSARQIANIPQCLGVVAVCRMKWSATQTVVVIPIRRRCHSGGRELSQNFLDWQLYFTVYTSRGWTSTKLMLKAWTPRSVDRSPMLKRNPRWLWVVALQSEKIYANWHKQATVHAKKTSWFTVEAHVILNVV